VSSVVICGGGVVGLCTAMMLARDGLDVSMFEADPAEPPAPVDAWSSWTRKGVAQFRQPHNLFGRFRQICDDELPGLTDKLLAAGCVWVDFLESLPPGIDDRAPRPGDDRMRFQLSKRCSPKPRAGSPA
jgi:2-polyprenyl-6-methoxyphenol hydroxylase-like FAD-dependent oxidoreductase